MSTRKPPRWVVAFLRALERTGRARAAAEDAGIDHTTAYVRRKSHADFAAGWAEALTAHKAAKERADEEGRANGRAPALSLPPLSDGCPSPPRTFHRSCAIDGAFKSAPPAEGGGAEYVVSGGQLKRASSERWGKRRQEDFLAELAATGNLRRACKAVGISYQAVRKRRRKDAHLDAACIAAIEACRARIPEFLAVATAQTFDPDSLLDDGDSGLPKVTVAEAIKIAQLKGPPGVNRQPEIEAYDVEEVRQRLERKMRMLGLLDDKEREAAYPAAERDSTSPDSPAGID